MPNCLLCLVLVSQYLERKTVLLLATGSSSDAAKLEREIIASNVSGSAKEKNTDVKPSEEDYAALGNDPSGDNSNER